MAVSSELINYVLRPAKHVERKMLRDTFRRLSAFGPLESYRYIGFGAVYFSDFLLFHKSLGINDMVSIESDVANMARYQFNRPFRTIDLMFMPSSVALSTLSWEGKTILWLDYDETLKEESFADIATFVTHALSGSVLVISMNVHPNSLPGSSADSKAVRLRRQVGPLRVPAEIGEKDFTRSNFPETCRGLINDEILKILAARNGLLPAGKQMRYQQLFNFRYKDGAPMLTIGGLLFSEEDRLLVDQCHFSPLKFLKKDIASPDFYEIRVPNLTYKELHDLDAQLPLTGRRRLRGRSIPADDLQAYAEIYPYFSKFAEADV